MKILTVSVGKILHEKLMVASLSRNLRLLWNPKIYYWIHKSLPLNPITMPAESSPHPPCFLKIRYLPIYYLNVPLNMGLTFYNHFVPAPSELNGLHLGFLNIIVLILLAVYKL
jgi:hypothetical protein